MTFEWYLLVAMRDIYSDRDVDFPSGTVHILLGFKAQTSIKRRDELRGKGTALCLSSSRYGVERNINLLMQTFYYKEIYSFQNTHNDSSE